MRCVRTGRQCPGYPEEKPHESSTIKIYNLEVEYIANCYAFTAVKRRVVCPASLIRHCGRSWCYSEASKPVIRNDLAAFSFLYRDHIRQGSMPLGEIPTHLQAIAKSHRQLWAYLVSSRVSPETALICSLIFYILECLFGNAQQAIWHLSQGLMLLERCRTAAGTVAGSDSIYTHLTTVYARLDIHASSFDNERIPILKLTSLAQVAGYYKTG